MCLRIHASWCACMCVHVCGNLAIRGWWRGTDKAKILNRLREFCKYQVNFVSVSKCPTFHKWASTVEDHKIACTTKKERAGPKEARGRLGSRRKKPPRALRESSYSLINSREVFSQFRTPWSNRMMFDWLMQRLAWWLHTLVPTKWWPRKLIFSKQTQTQGRYHFQLDAHTFALPRKVKSQFLVLVCWGSKCITSAMKKCTAPRWRSLCFFHVKVV